MKLLDFSRVFVKAGTFQKFQMLPFTSRRRLRLDRPCVYVYVSGQFYLYIKSLQLVFVDTFNKLPSKSSCECKDACSVA